MMPQSGHPNEFPPDEEAVEQKAISGHLIADDFAAEEVSFAQELNSLFSLEREELPPLFIQTLRNEQTDWLPPARLELRLRYRVFRKLQLPPPMLSSDARKQKQGPRHFQKSFSLRQAIPLSTLLAVLLVFLFVLSPLLSNGATALLAGPQRHIVPAYSQQSISHLVLTQYMSIREVQAVLPFTPFWPGDAPQNYNYQSLLLHMGQSWSDGPVVELQYGHDDPRLGYGRLTVHEFRPVPGNTTLLVAPPDAIQTIQFNGRQATYISGRWIQENGEVLWESGVQVELIFQANGLVFWLTGDSRDEATPERLIELAELMQPLYLGTPRPHLPELKPPLWVQSAQALSQPAIKEADGQLLVAAFPKAAAKVYVTLGEPLL